MALKTDLRIALRNLGRNRKRTALGVGAIFVAQIAVLWFTGFMNGYEQVVLSAVTGPMLGHIQIHAVRYREKRETWNGINDSAGIMDNLRKDPGVAQVSARCFAPVLAALGETGETALVTGLEMDKENQPQGLLASLKETDLPGKREALIGVNLAAAMGVKAGDTLALVGQCADGATASGLFKVKGVVRTAADAINRKGILMPLAAAQDFLNLPGQAHEIVLRLKDPSKLDGLAARLRGEPGLKGLEVLTWKELQPQLAAIIETFEKANLLVLALIFITTIAGIANTMLMAGFERTHEFGVLMALGCRPRRLIGTLVYEALALGLSGVFLGTLAGLALVAFQSWHGLTIAAMKDFAIEGVQLSAIYPFLRLGDVARSVFCVAVTALLASWFPAERVAKLDPLEAMRS